MYKLPSGMDWYVAKIVYQVISGDGKHTPQFDEQLRLIKADEPAWAKEKALTLGRIGETSFFNTRNEAVRWRFIGVADIYRIDDIEDGVQLYSQTGEPEDAEEYIALTHTRERCLGELLERNDVYLNAVN